MASRTHAQSPALHLADRHEPNGDLFVGWGRLGRFFEFGANGSLLFDATLPPGYDTYRAYRFPWSGEPTTPPTASAHRDGPDIAVDASWNGATDVARWRILAGPDPGALEPVGSVAWNGLDTSALAATHARWVAVAAEDGSGHTLEPGDGVTSSRSSPLHLAGW